jgi:hypothetical protein
MYVVYIWSWPTLEIVHEKLQDVEYEILQWLGLDRPFICTMYDRVFGDFLPVRVGKT